MGDAAVVVHNVPVVALVVSKIGKTDVSSVDDGVGEIDAVLDETAAGLAAGVVAAVVVHVLGAVVDATVDVIADVVVAEPVVETGTGVEMEAVIAMAAVIENDVAAQPPQW